jgi:preprotein translocase subunit SecB
MESGDNLAGSGKGATLTLVGHYLKDKSFKNAGGPSGLVSQRQIDVVYDLLTRRADAEHFEVELRLRAKPREGGTPAFLLEVTYAGLFHLQNIPAEAVQSALLVDAPMMLFPYVRDIAAETLQKGGMPPLKLDSMDFAALYQAETGTEPVKNVALVSAIAARPAHQPEIREVFATSIYGAPLGVPLHTGLESACLKLAAEDEAGRAWSKAGFSGAIPRMLRSTTCPAALQSLRPWWKISTAMLPPLPGRSSSICRGGNWSWTASGSMCCRRMDRTRRISIPMPPSAARIM